MDGNQMLNQFYLFINGQQQACLNVDEKYRHSRPALPVLGLYFKYHFLTQSKDKLSINPLFWVYLQTWNYVYMCTFALGL